MAYLQFGRDYLGGAVWGSVSRLLTLASIITVIVGGSLLALLDVVDLGALLAGLGLSLVLALIFLHGGFVMYRDERRKREAIAAELQSQGSNAGPTGIIATHGGQVHIDNATFNQGGGVASRPPGAGPAPGGADTSWIGESTISDRSFRMMDLVSRPGEVVEGKVFEGCTIYGPVVLVPLGAGGFEFCGFDGPFDAVFWTIPSSRLGVIGALAVRDCTFRRCNFVGVGIAGPLELGERFQKRNENSSR